MTAWQGRNGSKAMPTRANWGPTVNGTIRGVCRPYRELVDVRIFSGHLKAKTPTTVNALTTKSVVYYYAKQCPLAVAAVMIKVLTCLTVVLFNVGLFL